MPRILGKIFYEDKYSCNLGVVLHHREVFPKRICGWQCKYRLHPPKWEYLASSQGKDYGDSVEIGNQAEFHTSLDFQLVPFLLLHQFSEYISGTWNIKKRKQLKVTRGIIKPTLTSHVGKCKPINIFGSDYKINHIETIIR